MCWTCGRLWPKVAEEMDGTGLNGLKASYYAWCPVFNHPGTSLSPPASQGHKICRIFTEQKPLWALSLPARGFLTVDNYSNHFLPGSAKLSSPAGLSLPLSPPAVGSACGLISLQPGFLLPSVPRGCCSSNTRSCAGRQAQPGTASGQGCIVPGPGIPAPPGMGKAPRASAAGSGTEV